MAKLTGGLHGRAAGNVGGIIYGAARTRLGKVVTARELVIPANPQTAAQTNQRDKFLASLRASRAAGPDFYQEDWNRSVGQLPGFQSLMSILLHAIDDDNKFLVAPDVTPLGTLHTPATITWEWGVGTEITLTWSTEAGDNGDPADTISYAVWDSSPGLGMLRWCKEDSDVAIRSAGTYAIDPTSCTLGMLCVMWLTSTLPGAAHLSHATWFWLEKV